MGIPERNENSKNVKSKLRDLHKSLLNYCDKYDKGKEYFEEYYNPIKERYQEIIKISPNLISISAQETIQEIFDNVDKGISIPDDFCSVMRGEIEPVLRRLGISPEEILQEMFSEQIKSSVISAKKIIAIAMSVAVAIGGGIIIGDAYYSDPFVEYSLYPSQLPADLHGTSITINDVYSTNDKNEIIRYDCDNESIIRELEYAFDCIVENSFGNKETVTTAISVKEPNNLLDADATDCVAQHYILSDDVTSKFPYLLDLPNVSTGRLLALKNNHIKLMDDYYEKRDYVLAKKHATIVLKYFSINDLQALSTMGNVMRDEDRQNASGTRCAIAIHSTPFVSNIVWGKLSLAEDHHVSKDYEKSIYWSSLVIDAYENNDSDIPETSYMIALIIKANALYRMALNEQNGFAEAKSYYDQANEIRESYDTWFGLGNIDRHEGKFKDALEKYEQARVFADDTGEIDEEINRLLFYLES